MLPKSSFQGMNDDSCMKYHCLSSLTGVRGLATHKHRASYSYGVNFGSASFGKLFTYHIVDTIISHGAFSAGNFQVILEILRVDVSTFVMSLLVRYHQFSSHHRKAFNGCACIVHQ
jgi:hypothetical protein